MVYKFIIFTLSLAVLLSCTKIDKDIQDFDSGSAYPESVAMVKEAAAIETDTWVILTGKIITHIGDEIYIFQDATGEIRINIDNAIWAGLNFNPNLQVTIKGKVRNSISGVIVEVAKIEEKPKSH
jgi:uncharacterized protein (TIGR00156 family)